MQHDAPPLDTTSPGSRAMHAFLQQDPDFHNLTAVAVGARVVWWETQNKAAGATNSKLGTVESITFGHAPPSMGLPPGYPWVEALQVKVEDSSKPIIVTRSVTRQAWPHGTGVYKSTFPIMLAYAMTAHRAQVGPCRAAITPAYGNQALARCTSRPPRPPRPACFTLLQCHHPQHHAPRRPALPPHLSTTMRPPLPRPRRAQRCTAPRSCTCATRSQQLSCMSCSAAPPAETTCTFWAA